MRHAVGFLFTSVISAGVAYATSAVAFPLAPVAPQTPSLIKVEYFCSPGFEPGRGGTCVAVPSRAEIELYVDQPIYGGSVVYHHRHRRRHSIRERF